MAKVELPPAVPYRKELLDLDMYSYKPVGKKKNPKKETVGLAFESENRKLSGGRWKSVSDGTWKYGRDAVSELSLAGLGRAADLQEMQRLANSERAAEVEAAKVKNITLQSAARDARDVLLGVWDDIYRTTTPQENPMSVWDILQKGNRLRGLGFCFILFSLGGMVILNAFE